MYFGLRIPRKATHYNQQQLKLHTIPIIQYYNLSIVLQEKHHCINWQFKVT